MYVSIASCFFCPIFKEWMVVDVKKQLDCVLDMSKMQSRFWYFLCYMERYHIRLAFRYIYALVL